MTDKLSGIRWRMLRSYGLAAALAAVITAGVLYFYWPQIRQVYPGYEAFAAAACFLAAALPVNIVIAFQESKRLKKRLDALGAFAAVLAHGKFSQRLDADSSDELGRAFDELNGLAETMETQVASLQRLATSNKELASKAHTAAIIEERQRLARELHDAVSQQLFALTMLSDAAAVTLQQGEQPTEGQIRDIAELAARVQQEMRALLLHLRPVQLHEESLDDGIRNLAGELAERTGIQFELDLQPLPKIKGGVENHLFRILQEALSNILRHAQADKINVRLYSKDDELFMQIADNGLGFDPRRQKRASYGLQTMRERCEEIGGRFTVTSREAVGTRVDVRVPVRKERAGHEYDD